MLPLEDGKVIIAGGLDHQNALVYDLVTGQSEPKASSLFLHHGDDFIVVGERVFLLALDTTDKQVKEFIYG